MTAQHEAVSFNRAVGKRIHMLMWDQRVTQAAMADRLSIGQSAVSKKLRGVNGWDPWELREAARFLGTTTGYLLGEDVPTGGNALTIGYPQFHDQTLAA